MLLHIFFFSLISQECEAKNSFLLAPQLKTRERRSGLCTWLVSRAVVEVRHIQSTCQRPCPSPRLHLGRRSWQSPSPTRSACPCPCPCPCCVRLSCLSLLGGHRPISTRNLTNWDLSWEKNLQSLKSWARLPKVLQNLSGSAEPSSASFLLYETFCRTFLQNPNGSAESWVAFGRPGPSFEDRLFSSHKCPNRQSQSRTLAGVSRLVALLIAEQRFVSIFRNVGQP